MSKIKKPIDLKMQALLKVLIYGQPGIGKTTMSLSMPAPLMIDCDRGVHRIEPRFLTDTVEVESWSDIDEVLNENLAPYQTVIFDTGGKLIEYMTAHILSVYPKMKQATGQMSLQGYGVRKQMFQNLLARIHQLGKHVVFVAHEREDKDDDTRYVRPEIGGSSGNDLIKELDLVGYMEAIGTKRVIRFNPTEKFYAKNSLALPDPMPIPHIDEGNSFMNDIIELYQKHIEEKVKKGESYNELMAVIDSNVDDIKDAESANSFVEWIPSVEHIWDSKVQARKRLLKVANDLGLKFDKKTNLYK